MCACALGKDTKKSHRRVVSVRLVCRATPMGDTSVIWFLNRLMFYLSFSPKLRGKVQANTHEGRGQLVVLL